MTTLKAKNFKPAHKSATLKAFNPRRLIDKLYDSAWEKYRAVFLKHNPLCYCCKNFSNVVDHIESHQGNLDLFWKETNYLPLCEVCHNTVTALYDRNKKPGASNRQKESWLQWVRAKNSRSGKVYVVPFDSDTLTHIARLKSAKVRTS